MFNIRAYRPLILISNRVFKINLRVGIIMKKFRLGIFIIFLSLLLVGCQQKLAIPDVLDTKNDVEGFVEPELSDWVQYIKPVREYMYLRTQALLKNDINILWERYPALKEHINLAEGINVEQNELESLNKGHRLVDANYDIENYERIKVKTLNENEVIILVHGSILYLADDFEESGGEFLMQLFLRRNGDNWDVVKTDEYTLPEYKEWVQQKNQ